MRIGDLDHAPLTISVQIREKKPVAYTPATNPRPDDDLGWVALKLMREKFGQYGFAHEKGNFLEFEYQMGWRTPDGKTNVWYGETWQDVFRLWERYPPTGWDFEQCKKEYKQPDHSFKEYYSDWIAVLQGDDYATT